MAIPLAAAVAAGPSVGRIASAAAAVQSASVPIASATDLAEVVKPFTPDAFANGFATLIGALLGAMLAYLLQRRFQRNIERKNAKVSAHRLIFALLQQTNTIILIQRDYVFPELKNRGRFLSIPALAPFNLEKSTLQSSDLLFLLDDKAGRSILHCFYMAQENYIETLSQWNARSTLHLEKAQPALGASGLVSGADITEKQIEEALGTHVYGALINVTDNCILSLRRTFRLLTDARDKAREYITNRFGDDFMDFNTPDTYGLDDESTEDNSRAKMTLSVHSV
ncbi:hypothetical protein [Burkholderia pseudomallei]|uniref:hypothetical protein n=1 Tax=Burkholderia pseudomallei TaxID=28450 RepID=UPI0005E1988F|nr:hypothetical protein [Burkholderia pseudomallei]CAK1295235.1 Uncharacterised protein [Burkholderia pseudomallei]VBE87942.1 Uncharacterised protein [Burkholderia pseudomallei]